MSDSEDIYGGDGCGCGVGGEDETTLGGGIFGGAPISLPTSFYIGLIIVWVIALLILILDNWFPWVMVVVAPVAMIVFFLFTRSPVGRVMSVTGIM
jgi:hypothetical protein